MSNPTKEQIINAFMANVNVDGMCHKSDFISELNLLYHPLKPMSEITEEDKEKLHAFILKLDPEYDEEDGAVDIICELTAEDEGMWATKIMVSVVDYLKLLGYQLIP